MANEFEIVGLDAALEKLKSLPKDLQKKGLRTAVRKGATVIRRAAIANAKQLDDPETATNISKNIAVQFASRLGKTEGGIAYRVGVRGGARQYANTRDNRRSGKVGQTYKTEGSKLNPGGDTFYWRFLEFGTSRMRAQPFLLRSLTDNIDAATQAVATSLNAELDKLAK